MIFRKHSWLILFVALFCSAALGCARTVQVGVGALPGSGGFAGETCALGRADCNPCAPNVEAQFAAVFGNGEYMDATHSWTFHWQRTYSGSEAPARVYFDAPIVAGNGKLDSLAYHVQGFVRTNHPDIRYAGSHSNAHGLPGSLFFIGQQNGRNELVALQSSQIRHPSGVSVLGCYLLVGEKNFLRVVDMNNPGESSQVRYAMPKKDPRKQGMNPPGGGVAAVKMADGDILLVVTSPGGTRPGKRVNRFYRLSGELGGRMKRRFIAERPVDGPEAYQYSENLSLVTECDTGDVYGVHAGTNAALASRGYWRLSKLVERDGKPELVTRSVHLYPQNLGSCHLKSAGSAWVSPGGDMEFYCHEYINNPDAGSFDTWNFRRIYRQPAE